MLINMAVDGQGVALARTTPAAWDLINGPACPAVRCGFEIGHDLLDCQSQGVVDQAEGCDFSRLAVS
jgi:hypothetical protein